MGPESGGARAADAERDQARGGRRELVMEIISATAAQVLGCARSRSAYFDLYCYPGHFTSLINLQYRRRFAGTLNTFIIAALIAETKRVQMHESCMFIVCAVEVKFDEKGNEGMLKYYTTVGRGLA